MIFSKMQLISVILVLLAIIVVLGLSVHRLSQCERVDYEERITTLESMAHPSEGQGR